jgi:hypothetical protein
MDKIAAYEIIIAAHPLWEKEAGTWGTLYAAKTQPKPKPKIKSTGSVWQTLKALRAAYKA